MLSLEFTRNKQFENQLLNSQGPWKAIMRSRRSFKSSRWRGNSSQRRISPEAIAHTHGRSACTRSHTSRIVSLAIERNARARTYMRASIYDPREISRSRRSPREINRSDDIRGRRDQWPPIDLLSPWLGTQLSRLPLIFAKCVRAPLCALMRTYTARARDSRQL